MAILMRRGFFREFDPSKMLPGEWAISIDSDTQKQIVWMCFSAGVVKRMGTYEDFKMQIEDATDDIRESYESVFSEIEASMRLLKSQTEGYKNTASTKAGEAAASANSAANSANAAARNASSAENSASLAAASADSAEDYSMSSKSYAVGTDGAFREDDNNDCAKHYYERSKSIYDDFSAAGSVNGVKGDAENTYRTGLVNITPADIGLDRLDEKYAKKSIYGDDSISLGRIEGTLVGEKSVAIGDAAVRAKYSFGTGYGISISSGAKYSFACGNNIEVTEEAAFGAGYLNKSENFSSFSLGKYCKQMKTGGGLSNQIGDVFVIGNGTGSRSNAMRVTYLGDIMGTKAFQSSGADYAEYVRPWADGNPDNEDRVGYFVTVKDGLLYKANDGDYITGITSGNPSVVGNADEDYYWRYERDEFNRIVMEDVPETVQAADDDGNPLFDEETHEPIMKETGKIIPNARMKLSDDYDPALQEGYIPRSERPEWDCVGMLGVLPVRDDGTCLPDGFCRCGAGGVATFTQERGMDTYYVIERISDNVVSVLLK